MYKIAILILILTINFSSANNNLEKGNILKNIEAIKTNFSFNEEIKLEIKKINIGSAEAKKLPFSNYKITIDINDLENITILELNGLIAHEIAHLKSYQNKNFLQMILFGIKYSISDNFKTEIERQADIDSIKEGFKEELLAFREYRLQTANEKDREYLKKYYLSPEEIRSFN